MSLLKFLSIVFVCCTGICLSACQHGDKNNKNKETGFTLPQPAFPPKTQQGSDLKKIFNGSNLADWKEKMIRMYPDFSVQHFKPSEKQKINPVGYIAYTKESWKVFRPYFILSPDKKYAIDLHSYNDLPVALSDSLEGGEADNAVHLVNLSKHSKKQFLFAGPGTNFQNAAWMNDSVVVITGKSDANVKNKMLPISWLYNIYSDSITEYHYVPEDSID